MSLEDIKKTSQTKMDQSIAAFKNNLTKIRTGRANPAILDTIQVDYYGSFVPLSQVANLTLLDPTPPSITLADGVTQRQLTHLFESNNVVANVKLFYTLGPVTVQGAWNHLSPQLFSVSTTDRLQDRVFAAIDIFDAQVRFELSRNVTIVAQGKNLTNSRPRRMFGPNFGLLREELDNGSAYYIGALVRF